MYSVTYNFDLQYNEQLCTKLFLGFSVLLVYIVYSTVSVHCT